MNFTIDDLDANVTNINLRREKHGDDRVTAVDINISAEVPPNVLDQLSYGDDQKFETLLYDKDGNKKVQGLEEFKFNTVFDNHTVKLNYSLDEDFAKEFDEVRIHKFKGDPKSGHIVDLTFQVSLRPSEEQLHWLTDGYGIQMWTLSSLGSKQKELFDGPETGEETEEGNEAA